MMKIRRAKRIASLMFIFVFAGFLFTTSVLANNINIRLNDKPVVFPDVKPFVNQDNRTMVPIRFVTEQLGMQIKWDASSKTVTILDDDKSVSLTIGKKTASINGKTTSLDTAPVLMDNRTLVPLRFVSESFRASISWDAKTQTVSLVIMDSTTGQTTVETKKPQAPITETITESEKVETSEKTSDTSSNLVSCKFGDLNPSPFIIDIPSGKYVLLQVTDLDIAASKLGTAKADLLSGKVRIATKVDGVEHMFEVKDVFEDGKIFVLETSAVVSADSVNDSIKNLDVYKK